MLASVTKFLERPLRLRVNRQKSAAAPVSERKFLRHPLLPDGTLTIAPKGLDRAKDRVREITRRNRSVRFERIVSELNSFLVRWVTYYRHAKARRDLYDLGGDRNAQARSLCA